jgi:uncharacterized protein YjiS (DUF1127 family)
MRSPTATSAMTTSAAAEPNGIFRIARIIEHELPAVVATLTTAGDATWAILREWWRRAMSRRELRSLSRRQIADFCPGLSEAEHEARKPFWRA